ncbi:MAG: hypothetical protein L6R39_001728 [Caloplaca ligustica]|nr:MAG: hypothetical protein L6R39_001728 [Caloplaca ligustica]
MPIWDFVRAIGQAAGHPVNRRDVWVLPKKVGLAIALIVDWVVWLLSLGKQRSTMNRAGIRYSCLTRTYRIDKAKERLGYKPSVSIEEGIWRGVGWWLADKKKKIQ